MSLPTLIINIIMLSKIIKRRFATELRQTHLHDYHRDVLAGKMVPFAGYSMPVQYKAGIIKEHMACR
jgi:hypothetical protein